MLTTGSGSLAAGSPPRPGGRSRPGRRRGAEIRCGRACRGRRRRRPGRAADPTRLRTRPGRTGRTPLSSPRTGRRRPGHPDTRCRPPRSWWRCGRRGRTRGPGGRRRHRRAAPSAAPPERTPRRSGSGPGHQFVDHVGELVAATRVGVRPGQLPYLIHAETTGGERLMAHRHLGAQPGGTHPLGHRGIGGPDRRFHPRAHRNVTVVAEQLPAISGGDDRRGLRLQLADRPLHLPQPGRQRPPIEGLEIIPAARLRALQRTHVPEYDQGVSQSVRPRRHRGQPPLTRQVSRYGRSPDVAAIRPDKFAISHDDRRQPMRSCGRRSPSP